MFFFFVLLLLFARLFFLVSSSSLVPHPSLPEHRPVQDVPDRPVGRLPHLLQLELLDARLVGRDRRALDADAVLQDGVGGVDRHLVVGGVAVREPQVVVLDGEVEVGEDELLLDLGPDDAGGFFFSFSGSFFFQRWVSEKGACSLSLLFSISSPPPLSAFYSPGHLVAVEVDDRVGDLDLGDWSF